MKIVFTGGGTGGHFYPIIAVIEAVRKEAAEKSASSPELYFLAPDPYKPELLEKWGVTFRHVSAGKRRGYNALKDFLDLFVTLGGIFQALFQMFRIFPDVVFSKGGYTAFPVLVAARFFGIPVVIHESDSRPGKVTEWSAKFAKKIALSFSEAREFLPKGVDEKSIAITGNPVREGVRELGGREEGCRALGLDESVPTILVLGGSQGAKKINESIINIVSDLTERANVVHQTGEKNFDETEETARVILERTPTKARYHAFAFLDDETMRSAASCADVVVTRGGSGIFEVALWGVPAIVIPLPTSARDHQRSNAFAMAREGACVVIEEANLTTHVFLSQIETLLTDEEKRALLIRGMEEFAKRGAAEKIARALIDIGMRHAKN